MRPIGDHLEHGMNEGGRPRAGRSGLHFEFDHGHWRKWNNGDKLCGCDTDASDELWVFVGVFLADNGGILSPKPFIKTISEVAMDGVAYESGKYSSGQNASTSFNGEMVVGSHGAFVLARVGLHVTFDDIKAVQKSVRQGGRYGSLHTESVRWYQSRMSFNMS